MLTPVPVPASQVGVEAVLTSAPLFEIRATEGQSIEQVMAAHGNPKPGYTGGLESGGYSLRDGLLRFKVGATLMSFRQQAGTWQKT